MATTSYPNRYYNIASSSLTATTTKHIFSPDGTLLATVVGVSTTASTTYLHPDHLGGTNVTTNSSGVVTQTLDYYTYGSQRIATGSCSEQRRFIGEEFDADTEFSYLNARYYQGSRGQFMSQDPVFLNLGVDKRTKALLTDPQLQNAYGYARNNPLAFKDTTGQIAFLAVPAATAIWGLIATGFTGMAMINTLESAYSNFWLPSQYPLAYTPEQKQEAPFRFLAEAALNWGSEGATLKGGVLLDSTLLSAEYLPADQGGTERKRSIHSNQSASKVNLGTRSQGGSSASGSGRGAYNYIYSKPFGSSGGNTSSQGSLSGYSLSTAQQGALQNFQGVVNTKTFDAQSFVNALRAVVSAFGGGK